jgi:ABC-type phosphate transport system substrate-binding protein
MEASRHRPAWLLVRLGFYVLVVVAVFLLRGPSLQRSGGAFRFPTESDTVKTITLVGRELAPELIPELVSHYERSSPGLHVKVEDGGTLWALEALANGRAAVGLLVRPPTRSEKELLVSAVRDSVLVFPFALGGIAILAHERSGIDSLAVNDLRRFLRDEADPRFERLYAPDPNLGLWDAFRSSLGFSGEAPPPAAVVFLKDEAAVVQAVAVDARSVGIASTLSLPDTVDAFGVRALAVRSDRGGAAVRPEYERIGYGEYVLYHYLYAACLANRSVRAAMFVTHLTSDRGQRQIERAGFLPARQTSRTIYLTRHPLGGKQAKEEE